MKNVAILALDNTLASTVTGPLDILGQAGVLWNQIAGVDPEPFFNVRIVSVDGKPVRCHNNVILDVQESIHDVQNTGLIIISSEDLNILDEMSKKVTPWLVDRFERGASIASICTGAFLLAETGLLDHKRATTHWGYADLFRKRYPKVKLHLESLVTDEGNLFCSGGAHSYLDLSLYLVEKYCGYEVAVQCAKSLLLDMGRTSQTPYAIFEFQKNHQDRDILKAQDWIEQHFSQEIILEELADLCSMSIRNFKRRFKKATGDTPLGYVQRFRIEAAKRLLQKSRQGIEEIAYEAGYNDAGFFREIFKRYTGISPASYRRKYQEA